MTTEECLEPKNIQRFYYGPDDKLKPEIMFSETTPAYFTTPGAAHRLKLYNPNIKIVLVTCDPVKRALSDYRHSINIVNQPTNSGHYINVIRMATRQYLNSSVHFENIVDQALYDINDKNDSEIYQMMAEKYRVENDFWRKSNADDKEYTTNNISAMFKNETSRISFSPLTKMVIDGMYDLYLAEWLKHFKLNSNLMILDNMSLRDDPFTELERVLNFLEMKPFLTREIFYKPADSPFYCTDYIEVIKQSNSVRKELGMKLLKEINETHSGLSSKLKLTDTEDGRIMYLDCKSGKELLLTSELICNSDNAEKSRSLTTKETDEELNAMDKLRHLYISSKQKLEKTTGQKFYWSF